MCHLPLSGTAPKESTWRLRRCVCPMGPDFSFSEDTRVPDKSDIECAEESRWGPRKKGFFGLDFICISALGKSELASVRWELGMMAEDVSENAPSLFLPFTLSFSFAKGDLVLSFTDKSNMLAVMLFLMNWILTFISPLLLALFPCLDSKLNHLKEKEKLGCNMWWRAASELRCTQTAS